MHPILSHLNGLTIYTYGFMINLGFIVTAILLYFEAKKEEFDPLLVLEALLASVVAGIIGTRLLYIALNWEFYSSRPISHIITNFDGLTFYGGFFFGWFALYLWSIWRKVNFFQIADMFAPYLILGYAFGRIGCFLNGCCFGRASDLPWALPANAADPILRHPVQLYATVGALAIYFLLKIIQSKKPFTGFTLVSLFALYGTLRFITEFFRFENPLWLNLTLAQLFSLGLVLISLLIIFIIMRFHGSKSKTR